MNIKTDPKRNTILHIISGLSTGGAEWALFNLLNGGLAERYENHVISLSDYGTLGPKISELGVPVTALAIRGPLPSPEKIRLLRRATRNLEAQLIQGWMYHGNLGAVVARAFTHGRPALVWNVRHCLYQLRHEKPITQWVIRANRLLSKSTDGVLYNSQLSREQHETFGFADQQGVVIPNGIDLQRFHSSLASRESIRAELAIPQQALVVGHVGRFHPMKDHARFLRAAAAVCEKYTNAHFVLVGRGVSLQERTLSDLVPARATDRFHLLGERNDVSCVMNGMDMLCQSSWAEAFPNVLGEAMAVGVPCVATDVGDSATIVGDTGFVVPPRDEYALAAKIGDMLAMSKVERDQLGENARARIRSCYALNIVVDKYVNLYEKLIPRTQAH